MVQRYRFNEGDSYCEGQYHPEDNIFLVTALFSDPSARRTGVATRLVKRAVECAVQLQCNQLECIVDSNEAATLFWQSIPNMKLSTYYGMVRGQLFLRK